MSHELESTDGLALVGRPAWHGIGTVLPEGTYTPADGARIAGLQWRVRVAPLVARTEEPAATDGGPRMVTAEHEVPDHRAIVREDTGAVLGVVSPGYTPVQNAELVELLQRLGRPVETMGSMRDGRVVFALLRQGAFRIGAGDEVRQYLLAVTGHDGTRALSFLPTDVRVVCANTLRAAERAGDGATVRLAHTSGITERLKTAAASLERAEALVSTRREDTERLAGMALEGEALDRYFARTVEDIRGLPAGAIELDGGRLTFHGSTPGERRPDLLLRRDLAVAAGLREGLVHPFQALAPRGSAWRAFQAVSHYVHHGRRPGKVERTEGLLLGSAGATVSRAFARALEFAG